MIPFVPEDLRTTTTSVWLLIARYNRSAWNDLGALQIGADTLQDVAHERAEVAFPESPNAKLLPYPPGVLMLRSFDTQLHAQLKRRFIAEAMLLRAAQGKPDQSPVEFPDAVSKQIVEQELQSFAAGVQQKQQIQSAEVIIAPSGIAAVPPNAKSIHTDIDPGIGWVALVHPDSLEHFFNHLGGRDAPLSQMYDIEAIPLNGDLTTNDIYEFMTPVNWRK